MVGVVYNIHRKHCTQHLKTHSKPVSKGKAGKGDTLERKCWESSEENWNVAETLGLPGCLLVLQSCKLTLHAKPQTCLRMTRGTHTLKSATASLINVSRYLEASVTNAEHFLNYTNKKVWSLMPFPPLLLWTAISMHLFIQHIFAGPGNWDSINAHYTLLNGRGQPDVCFHKKLLYCSIVSPFIYALSPFVLTC